MEHTASDSEDDGLPWLPRTNLNEVDAKGMDIKPQNGVIKQVMRHAFAIGDRMIVFGSQDSAQTNGRPDFDMLNSMSTPMDKVLLDKIALAALVSAAENLGYGDNDYDVADRLERGSYRHYIKPITTYVRLMYRRAHKMFYSFVVLGCTSTGLVPNCDQESSHIVC